MDQYDSQRPCDRQRHAQDGTPIYDRLLAEWRAAHGSPEAPPPAGPERPRAGSRVPAARTSGEAVDG
ncbi:hypothetical protein OH786_28415 [Streptomyces atratus]|uniref:Uncharacterized protein n=1 Tax=Streptomyces atratus TaxID=1893 RepID=A0A1K2BWY3_STRAR|nr:hypothetical protein [Streptomyces atratus]SFY03129.1 hypothetical protein SAMN02787144_1009221 [Streptomyces atratus]